MSLYPNDCHQMGACFVTDGNWGWRGSIGVKTVQGSPNHTGCSKYRSGYFCVKDQEGGTSYRETKPILHFPWNSAEKINCEQILHFQKLWEECSDWGRAFSPAGAGGWVMNKQARQHRGGVNCSGKWRDCAFELWLCHLPAACLWAQGIRTLNLSVLI